MEVFVSSPIFRFSNFVFPDGSLVRDLLTRFVQQQGGSSSSSDFYVVTNGHLSHLEDGLQRGAVYHLEPRLRGGKGGFGSMLRALGAQIEKTTNREACRDLSGRRLRDVNHEKEMAEWLKKQAEREAEKEQRRLERLQRKLSEPKHQFTDPEYQRQCHDLSERLEDSVMKGLQASSGSQVSVHDVSAAKRPGGDQSEQPHRKKRKTTTTTAACFWMGVDDELSSEDEESPSSSSCGAAAVTMTTQIEEAEPEQSSSSSAASSQTSRDQPARPPETSRDQPARPPETSRDQPARPPETSRDQPARQPETSRDQTARPPETSRPSDESQQQGRPAVDVSSLSSVEQLQALGLDVLKDELMSRGLKCGGTLAERAARLLSVRGQTPDQIDPALLAKPTKAKRK